MPRLLTKIIAMLISATAASMAYGSERNMVQRAEVQLYLDEIAAEHRFDRDQLETLFAPIYSQVSVLERIAKPAERTLKWHQYRDLFMTDKRIDTGVKFIRKHAAIFDRVEAEYGVPAEIIAAIIGVETFYGEFTGSDKALAALATLAFDYPPRAKFFRSELTQLLLLAREERFDPSTIRGSYAAAMGMPQFIASSYRNFAIDFDQDGRRDLWSSPADIIASVANYFLRHGWRQGEAIVERVYPKDKSYKTLISKELKPSVGVSELGGKGLNIATHVNSKVSVMDFRLARGQETWVGFHNFYVITRYNHSRLYAMAVFQLSEALKHARV